MADYTIINGELYHHGRKGQRWGIRRYQNSDGTLTDAGRKRYLKTSERYAKKASKTSDSAKQDKYKKKSSDAKKALKQDNALKARLAKEEKKRKAEEEKIAKEKAAEEARVAKEKLDAAKKHAINKGSAADILKLQGEFTNDELQYAITRIERERKLSSFRDDDIAAGEKQAKDVVEKLGDIASGADSLAKIVKSGSDIYSTFVTVQNTRNKNKKK